MKITKRLLSVLLILIMVISITGVGFADEGNTVTVHNVRIAGQSRFGTAQQGFKAMVGLNPSLDTVVIANGTNFPDALAGAYFAHKNNAALLLTDKDDTYCVSAFLASHYFRRNLKVYILGGTAAISSSVETMLRSHLVAGSGNVTRIGGGDRYDTNLKILNKISGASSSDILVCSGKNFPDALSGSGVRLPILLVGDELSSAQKSFLGGYKNRNIYILGGTGAVSGGIESALRSYGSVTRLGGADRYETSYKVANYFYKNATKGVFLATGDGAADGLVAGPIAMKKAYPILLVNKANYKKANKFVKENQIGNAVIMGGQGAIPTSVASQAISWTSSSVSKPANTISAIRNGLKDDPGKPVADVHPTKRKIVAFGMDNARRNVRQHCNGFVEAAYNSVGYDVDFDYSHWNQTNLVISFYKDGKNLGGTKIPGSKTTLAEPGDVIYYRNAVHFALYLGNKVAIHGGWKNYQTDIYWYNPPSSKIVDSFWQCKF